MMKKHKYCIICGAEVMEKGTLFECTSCHHRQYKNPVACNAVIVTNDKRQILFVRRKIEPHSGMWDLPGGFIELHETAEESVVREIHEELGTTITNLTYVTSATDSYVYQNLEYQTLCFIFSGSIGTQTIHPQDDIDGYQFFRAEELPIQELAFESLKRVIEDFFRKQNA